MQVSQFTYLDVLQGKLKLISSGTLTEKTVPDAPMGSKVYQASSKNCIFETIRIPINPNRKYCFQCNIRNLSPDNLPRGTFYVGAFVYDYNHKAIKGDGTYWYYFIFGKEGSTLTNIYQQIKWTIGKHQPRALPP